ncbi:GLPGLI family protein [Leadbetterella byssophila]|uniref:GLPGLI family protein n=1 Tax=Leadbetterella byssophila TaxID=316068 RepID=UPI0039A22ECC
MGRLIRIIILCLLALPSLAQKTAGTINYTVTKDWIKFFQNNKYLTNEEKSRASLTWKNDPHSTQKMQLRFTAQGSHYGKDQDERGSSWQKVDYEVWRDFTKNTVKETQLIAGKVYQVEDSLYTYPWKIKSEIKEVAGYLCMLATTFDPQRNVEIQAWFTTDIPVGVGPDDFLGLPGAILEVDVDNGTIVFQATKVSLDPNQSLPPLPKKTKGKIIRRTDYLAALDKYIKDSEKLREAPWGLRY